MIYCRMGFERTLLMVSGFGSDMDQKWVRFNSVKFKDVSYNSLDRGYDLFGFVWFLSDAA